MAEDTVATSAPDAPSASDEAQISTEDAGIVPALSTSPETVKPVRKRAPRRKKVDDDAVSVDTKAAETVLDTTEIAPVKRRGRPRKTVASPVELEQSETSAIISEEHAGSAPKRSRTTRAKPVTSEAVTTESTTEAKPVRRRGRPKKSETVDAAQTQETESLPEAKAVLEDAPVLAEVAAPAPRRRGRPKKVKETDNAAITATVEENSSLKTPRRRKAIVETAPENTIVADTVPLETVAALPITDVEPEATTPLPTETPHENTVTPPVVEDDRPLFSSLPLGEPIMRAIQELGYLHPTPIQAQAIPEILKGHDVLGVAQTGTGKTASFTLPMLEKLSGSRARARMPRSLILEPTRELALQVADNFKLYGKYLRLSHALLIGGESMAEQREVLNRGVDVLIATPGRLLDLFARGGLLMTQTSLLVIDEADRMLDMGFIPDIEKIVTLLPQHRQTLFFSATMAPEIRRLADAFLRQPVEITVSRQSSVASTIEENLIIVEETSKRRALRKLLKNLTAQNAIVFCNRKRDVDMLQRYLTKHDFAAGHLHGDLAQSLRFATLERFKAGDLQVLVCSDVAARGIDIGGLSYVFNYDLPFNAEDYVHRIGRTGRAGKKGHALSIATPKDRELVEAIEALTGKAIEIASFPNIDTISWDHTPLNTPAPAVEDAPEAQEAPAVLPDDDLSQQAGEGRKRKRRRSGRNRRSGTDNQVDSTPEIAPTNTPRQEEPVRARGVSIELAPAFENDVPRTGFGGDTPAFMLIPRRSRSAAPVQDADRNAPIQHDGRHYGDE